MSEIVRYDALIVDPVPESRMRLRSVISVLGNFNSVTQAARVSDAPTKSAAQDSVDVYFISSEFDEIDVRSCIEKCRGTKSGRDAAFVLVLKVADQGRTAIAGNVLCGADGFLFEPYSIEQLIQITDMAARVKKERRIERENKGIRMALTEVVPTLDKVATTLSMLGQAPRSAQKFKKACAVLATLSPDAITRYYEIATEVFEAARPPYDSLSHGGSNASEMLRRRARDRAIAKAKEDELSTEGEA